MAKGSDLFGKMSDKRSNCDGKMPTALVMTKRGVGLCGDNGLAMRLLAQFSSLQGDADNAGLGYRQVPISSTCRSFRFDLKNTNEV